MSLSVYLLPGLNLVPIEVFGPDNRQIAVDTIEVFYHAALGNTVIPAGFSKKAFHKKSQEEACVRCHSSGTTGSASDPLKCESCHSAIAAQRSVHGPFGSNDCSTCHQMEAGSGYGPSYAPENERETCFQCHDDVATDVQSKEFVHTPLVGGQCSSCHSPHASPNLYQLRKTVNETCFSCHYEKKEGNHPVAFHPVEGSSDPRSPKKELRCASCHNPHASSTKALMAGAGGYFELCQSCHKK